MTGPGTYEGYRVTAARRLQPEGARAVRQSLPMGPWVGPRAGGSRGGLGLDVGLVDARSIRGRAGLAILHAVSAGRRRRPGRAHCGTPANMHVIPANARRAARARCGEARQCRHDARPAGRRPGRRRIHLEDIAAPRRHRRRRLRAVLGRTRSSCSDQRICLPSLSSTVTSPSLSSRIGCSIFFRSPTITQVRTAGRSVCARGRTHAVVGLRFDLRLERAHVVVRALVHDHLADRRRSPRRWSRSGRTAHARRLLRIFAISSASRWGRRRSRRSPSALSWIDSMVLVHRHRCAGGSTGAGRGHLAVLDGAP